MITLLKWNENRGTGGHRHRSLSGVVTTPAKEEEGNGKGGEHHSTRGAEGGLCGSRGSWSFLLDASPTTQHPAPSTAGLAEDGCLVNGGSGGASDKSLMGIE